MAAQSPNFGILRRGGRRRTGARLLLGLLLSSSLLSQSCSVKKYAISKLGDALAGSGETFASDPDPELIRDAVPFSLKLIESLLAESPRHKGLLEAACRGFTQYSYAFVQQDADRMEDEDFQAALKIRDRARGLYLRARDYGLRALEVDHRGFAAQLKEAPEGALRRITKRETTGLLYWTAAAWGAAISISKDRPDLIADQPMVEAMIDRALALDEDWGEGAIHGFLISYEPSRVGAAAGAEERAEEHFRRAMTLSGGLDASLLVAYAETVCVARQDRAEFEQRLTQALAIDVDRKPAIRLSNLIMQQRARWLLDRTAELFLE
ncbi:MAG: TRAP transporter TatT component family protein [Acidobacteria bacterium]|nr:TRAP transporter TatT component family protein [Acidobacteriota bacterium]